MKLAVKFYRDLPNPDQYPGYWPAKCVELDDDDTDLDGYTMMSLKELEAYKDDYREQFDEWRAGEGKRLKQLREYQPLREAKFAQMDGDTLDALCHMAQALYDSGIDISEQMETLLKDRRQIKYRYPKA